MARGLVGLSLGSHVLAEMREDGSKVLLLEHAGGGQRVFQLFARHKSGHRPPDKPIAGRPLAQPLVLGCYQENTSRDTHEGTVKGDSLQED